MRSPPIRRPNRALSGRVRVQVAGFLGGLLMGIGGWTVSQARAEDASPFSDSSALLRHLDKDGDGQLIGSEIPAPLAQRLARIDTDGNGAISEAEFARIPQRALAQLAEAAGMGRQRAAGSRQSPIPGNSGREGEFYAPPAREEFDPETLEIGDHVPDFTLARLDGSGDVSLSTFEGKQPVVLVFGSITCQPFRQKVLAVSPLHAAYHDRAAFYMVYIREAHPESVLTVEEAGETVLRKFVQSDDQETRIGNAKACQHLLDLPYPVLVDGEDNAVKRAWSGWPIRLVVVDEHGKLAFDGGRGPKGFRPDLLANWLEARFP